MKNLNSSLRGAKRRGNLMYRIYEIATHSFAVLAMTTFLLAMTAQAQVRLGIDAMRVNDFEDLRGRRVALITNQTGIDSEGESTVDLFRKSKTIKLVCIMTPEHGFRGAEEHGQSVGDFIDAETKLPVYSLYGANNRPTQKMLKGVNAVVFDIQDVGTRFYTYTTTMAMAMEEAAKRKIRFYVLDRPNPIRGDMIDGDILDTDVRRMTGYFEIPVRHGLTAGEIANWINIKRNIGADLRILKAKRWQRDMWLDQTGLTFVPPSPNIRTLTAALLYSGVGCFEATNIAVGRGTDTPFEIFGAPWIRGKELCAYLRELNFSGVLFEPVVFTPEKDIYQNEKCEGVRIIVTNRNAVRPFQIFLRAFLYLHEKYPKNFKPEWEEVRVVSGSNLLRDAAEGRITVDELVARIEEHLAKFRADISSYFLY